MSIISRRQGQESSKSGKHLLTKDEFFTKYLDHNVLLQFGDGRLEDVEEMATAFDQIKAKATFNWPKKVNQDRGGIKYLYVEFKAPMGSVGAKFVLIGNIVEFLGDYFNGKFVTDFTLEELFDAAENR